MDVESFSRELPLKLHIPTKLYYKNGHEAEKQFWVLDPRNSTLSYSVYDLILRIKRNS